MVLAEPCRICEEVTPPPQLAIDIDVLRIQVIRDPDLRGDGLSAFIDGH